MSENDFIEPEEPPTPETLWRGRSRGHKVCVVVALASLCAGGLAILLSCCYLVPELDRVRDVQSTRLTFSSPTEARVRLAEAIPEASVDSTSDGRWRAQTKDGSVPVEAGSRPWQLEATADGFRINGRAVSGDSLTLRTAQRVFLFQGKAYRGSLTLYPKGGGLRAVNSLDLEQYLVSVVGSEMPTSWPSAALEAQAVAARTFAVYRLRERKSWNYNLSAADLAYGGLDAEAISSRQAVEETRGIVLRYSGDLFPTYFHSTCGGGTTSVTKVFRGPDIPPLQGVQCGWCSESPVFRWTKELSQRELTRALSELDVGLVESIKPLQTEPYGYPRWIEVNGKKIDANKFRLTVGANVIKSTAFQVARRGTKFVFKGKGWGHGVGLCQWGAYGLAVGGKDWSEILDYYYPGAETHVAM